MKHLILTLTILVCSLGMQATEDKYRVTAQTNSQYGQNNWVDLVIDGQVTSYGTTIYGVYYNDGYGLKRISKYVAYGYADGTYYVLINYKKYYFTFG